MHISATWRIKRSGYWEFKSFWCKCQICKEGGVVVYLRIERKQLSVFEE